MWERICERFGTPDAAIGKTDGIPDGIKFYNLNNRYNWGFLLVPDNAHEFGYWDPPNFNYDHEAELRNSCESRRQCARS